MSLEAMAIVLHHSRARGSAKLVLLGIANHAGDGGAWPSIYTLAKYGNVNERNARVAVRKLEQLGEIRVHIQAGGPLDMEDVHRPNRYDLLIACPTDCDRTDKHRTNADRERQLSLWKTRGQDPHTPRSLATPPVATGHTPLSLATPEPSIQPPKPTTGSASTTGHARPCSTCSQLPDVCRSRDALVPLEDRHDYTPTDPR